MAYDATRGVVVLFGGWHHPDHLGDTWEWDGNIWTQVATFGPSPRSVHARAYDAIRKRVVLFGGFDRFGGGGETWEHPLVHAADGRRRILALRE